MSVVAASVRTSDHLQEAIHEQTAKVGVIGLGDVGLPLVNAFIKAGYDVLGFDIDPRESPSFKLLELPLEQGAVLSYNDPHVPVLPAMRHYNVPRLASEPLTADYLAEQACVLIATDHSTYDWEFIVRHSPLVVDTRNATRNVARQDGKVWKA